MWYARELQEVLGYARWENFIGAIGRAMESCKTLGINVDDHFREVTKMVQLGSGSVREVQDFMLTRYACYLIAQNGDPKKVIYAKSPYADAYGRITAREVTRNMDDLSYYVNVNDDVNQILILNS